MKVRKTTSIQELVAQNASTALIGQVAAWFGSPISIGAILERLWGARKVDVGHKSQWSAWLLKRYLPLELREEWDKGNISIAEWAHGDLRRAYRRLDRKYAKLAGWIE